MNFTEIFQNKSTLENLCKFLEFDSLLEMRLVNKKIGQLTSELIWKTINENHYELYNFEELLIKNAHNVKHLLVNDMDELLSNSKITALASRLQVLKSLEVRYVYNEKFIVKLLEELHGKFEHKLEKLSLTFIGADEYDSQGRLLKRKHKKNSNENSIYDCVAMFTNLKSLIIGQMMSTPQDINSMLIKMQSKNLKHLTLDIEEPLLEESVQIITERYAQNLNFLEIGKLYNNSADEMNNLLRKAENLESLTIGDVFEDIPKQLISEISQKDCPKLKSINLNGHPMVNQYNNFLKNNWENVISLAFTGSMLSSETCDIIINNFKDLKHLSILAPRQCDQRGISNLIDKTIEQLSELQIASLKMDLSKIWKPTYKMQNMENLMFAEIKIDPKSITSILSNCENLSELVFDSTTCDDPEKLVSDIEKLSRENKIQTHNLTSLALIAINWEDETLIPRLIKAINKSLEAVDLSSTQISEETVDQLEEDYPDIRFNFLEEFESDFESEYDGSSGYEDGMSQGESPLSMYPDNGQSGYFGGAYYDSAAMKKVVSKNKGKNFNNKPNPSNENDESNENDVD
ncbi:hypothetical protein BB558_006536 [Smittium angustum]|uniref:F-box domain-containing protein n=1 Tax=Smittium angustum TaxID=133377 RepID=A0A2U1IXH6_SMIAN|nr:hypothetical protein BB558_006536 [Smittium angustum]